MEILKEFAIQYLIPLIAIVEATYILYNVKQTDEVRIDLLEQMENDSKYISQKFSKELEEVFLLKNKELEKKLLSADNNIKKIDRITSQYTDLLDDYDKLLDKFYENLENFKKCEEHNHKLLAILARRNIQIKKLKEKANGNIL